MNWRNYIRRERIYILPTAFGLCFLSLQFFTLLTAATYNNNLIYLLAFALFGMTIVTMIQTHNHLRGLDLEYIDSDDGFVDQAIQLRLRLINNKRRRRYLLQIYPNSKNLVIPSELHELDSSKQKMVLLPIKASKRGCFRLPKLIISTLYPLGLFKAWRIYEITGVYFAYPQALPIYQRNNNQFSHTEGLGSSQQSVLSMDEDFYEHRPYQVGESYRHLDWKLYARTKRKLTKSFAGPKPEAIVLILPAWPPGPALEHRLKEISGDIREALVQGIPFSLQSNNISTGLGSGDQHARQCWRELARYQGVA